MCMLCSVYICNILQMSLGHPVMSLNHPIFLAWQQVSVGDSIELVFQLQRYTIVQFGSVFVISTMPYILYIIYLQTLRPSHMKYPLSVHLLQQL